MGSRETPQRKVIANVTLNIFTNYVNIVADIDFPVVRAGKTA